MIVVFDVGNTNITVGVYQGESLLTTFRIMSKVARTSDEYGLLLAQFFRQNKLDIDDIKGVVVASVVPKVMHALTGAIRRYMNREPLIVGAGVKTGMKIKIQDPRSVGADRIADAVAAFEIYGGPILVIDFGTGTTYDLISADGTFMAGVTAPGMRVSAESLWENAAKLPEVEIQKPKSILAQETVASMQAGIVYGQIGQTEYIIEKIKEEAKLPNIQVVATGGLGRLIAEESQSITTYHQSLTLDGLRMIYEKNREEI
ncbi:MAG: type III pantothenate kinase [Lachnospiraceae bacterium]